MKKPNIILLGKTPSCLSLESMNPYDLHEEFLDK